MLVMNVPMKNQPKIRPVLRVSMQHSTYRSTRNYGLRSRPSTRRLP